jgi:hypothetical protein
MRLPFATKQSFCVADTLPEKLLAGIGAIIYR